VNRHKAYHRPIAVPHDVALPYQYVPPYVHLFRLYLYFKKGNNEVENSTF